MDRSQALGIATKINKGAIEIISQVQLAKKGEKVGSSEAVLLTKLGIKPFAYGRELPPPTLMTRIIAASGP
jgi:large subunit ribosomal protein LP0